MNANIILHFASMNVIVQLRACRKPTVVGTNVADSGGNGWRSPEQRLQCSVPGNSESPADQVLCWMFLCIYLVMMWEMGS